MKKRWSWNIHQIFSIKCDWEWWRCLCTKSASVASKPDLSLVSVTIKAPKVRVRSKLDDWWLERLSRVQCMIICMAFLYSSIYCIKWLHCGSFHDSTKHIMDSRVFVCCTIYQIRCTALYPLSFIIQQHWLEYQKFHAPNLHSAADRTLQLSMQWLLF